ncbi:hypothetical protein [Micromonospora zhanjiangensis]|uniref:Uncharacterized protein n=1 Tax=Micromonospora zhanjiangensis TaxID=1522057 RepID=A0ABV8KWA1_9ACTN
MVLSSTAAPPATRESARGLFSRRPTPDKILRAARQADAEEAAKAKERLLRLARAENGDRTPTPTGRIGGDR